MELSLNEQRSLLLSLGFRMISRETAETPRGIVAGS